MALLPYSQRPVSVEVAEVVEEELAKVGGWEGSAEKIADGEQCRLACIQQRCCREVHLVCMLGRVGGKAKKMADGEQQSCMQLHCCREMDKCMDIFCIGTCTALLEHARDHD
jgi:hypothetical protein